MNQLSSPLADGMYPKKFHVLALEKQFQKPTVVADDPAPRIGLVRSEPTM